MQTKKNCCTNVQKDFSTLSLVSVYDSDLYGQFDNYHTRKETADLHCLMLTLEGVGKIRFNDGTCIPLQKNSVFFGTHADISSMHSECEHWHHICYWFRVQNLVLPHNVAFIINDLNATLERADADRIIRLLQTKIPAKLQYANSYFCCKLLEFAERQNASLYKSGALIDEIISYVNAHVEQPLKVQTIANAFHYSEKHVHHLFKNALHVTPKQFINQVKLQNICHLLQTTTLSLQEISDKYAFASVSHLINNFKKQYGVTPTAYRKGN